MRIIAIVLFVLFPIIAFAQSTNMQNMNAGNMGNMMQEMQKCMSKVDQEEIKKLEQETDRMEAKFRTLCEQGKKDEAQEEAIKFGKKMMNNSAMVQMKECSEIAKRFVPKGAMKDDDETFDPEKHHVCDDIN